MPRAGGLSTAGMSVSMSQIDVEGSVYFSILVVSYFMWSAALDSSDVLQSYFIVSLASPMIIILLSNLFQT